MWNVKKKLMIAALVTLPFQASLLTAIPSAAHAEEMKMQRLISINGHGESRRKPDHAAIQIGVTSFAENAKDALAANTTSMQALFKALKEAGIADADMQTSNFSVGPRLAYNNEGQPPKTVGYDVNNMLTITVRKLDTLGAILDKSVSVGSNQINSVTFGVDDDQAALDEARKGAVQEARRKAELYATAAGVTLGNIMNISEAQAYQPGAIVYARAKAETAAADVPIAQGEQVLAVDVAIVWEIK